MKYSNRGLYRLPFRLLPGNLKEEKFEILNVIVSLSLCFVYLLVQDGVLALGFEQRPQPGLHHDVHLSSGVV